MCPLFFWLNPPPPIRGHLISPYFSYVPSGIPAEKEMLSVFAYKGRPLSWAIFLAPPICVRIPNMQKLWDFKRQWSSSYVQSNAPTLGLEASSLMFSSFLFRNWKWVFDQKCGDGSREGGVGGCGCATRARVSYGFIFYFLIFLPHVISSPFISQVVP